MTLHPYIIGIDVSKATLDIFDRQTGRCSRIGNNLEIICEQASIWRDADAFVVFEATGAYDMALRHCLSTSGVAHARVNPQRARHFARYAGYHAKTDRIDARMLAEMGARGGLIPEPPLDPEREALKSLHRRRDQLVAMRKAETTRLADAPSQIERESLATHITWLKEQIASFDKAIRDHIAASERLAAAAARLRSIPGCGVVSTATLLALMPELGHRNPRTIAALVGLAPINRDSGTFQGKRSIAGGRSRVRGALYMAALSASRSNTQLGRFYRSLIDANKPPKLALTALARKIVIIANSLIRDQSDFKPNPAEA
jgi:transposase